jgi:hypothetical protein
MYPLGICLLLWSKLTMTSSIVFKSVSVTEVSIAGI